MKKNVKKPAKGMPSNYLKAEECMLDDFDNFNREKTLFILPVSALEVHGYHLTNGTDMASSSLMAHESGRLFAKKYYDWTVVIMPLLNIGTDELPLPGSIEFSRKTVYRALMEYSRSLSRWGFKNLVITNGHGGLRHNLAIDDACRSSNRRFRMRMTAPSIGIYQDFIFGKKFPLIEAELGKKLKAREKIGLTDLEHAGGWETSIMLSLDRKQVSGDYATYHSSKIRQRAGLVTMAYLIEKVIRVIPLLKNALGALGLPLSEGFRIMATAGKLYDQKKERYTYSGDPSVASAEIGRAWTRAISKEILKTLEQVYITGSIRPRDVVSNFSAIYILRRGFILALKWIGIILLLSAIITVPIVTGLIRL